MTFIQYQNIKKRDKFKIPSADFARISYQEFIKKLDLRKEVLKMGTYNEESEDDLPF